MFAHSYLSAALERKIFILITDHWNNIADNSFVHNIPYRAHVLEIYTAQIEYIGQLYI